MLLLKLLLVVRFVVHVVDGCGSIRQRWNRIPVSAILTGLGRVTG